jgi:hypothetical protein
MSPYPRRVYETTLLMVTGFTFLSRLTQIAPPSTRFVFLGAGLRLGLPSHPASRPHSCLRLGVSTTSSPPGDSHPQSIAHAGRTQDAPPRAARRVVVRFRNWVRAAGPATTLRAAGRAVLGRARPDGAPYLMKFSLYQDRVTETPLWTQAVAKSRGCLGDLRWSARPGGLGGLRVGTGKQVRRCVGHPGPGHRRGRE